MSEHSNLPHDLPEYVPNWPVTERARVGVMKRHGAWIWVHSCPTRRRVVTLGFPRATQPEAFALALKHAQGCW